MGYYSEMFPQSFFYSDLSLDEIKERYERFKDFIKDKDIIELPNEIGLDGEGIVEYLSEYDFYEYGEGKYSILMYDYYGKHCAEKELCWFLSSIIKPETTFRIHFVGDDGEIWGYHIEYNKVHLLIFEPEIGDEIELPELNLNEINP